MQRFGKFGETGRVGRHRQFVEAAANELSDARCDLQGTAPGEWFAARQANALYPARDEPVSEVNNFLKAQNLAARQEGHVLRHAITTPHIATIGERKPHIIDATTKAVVKR